MAKEVRSPVNYQLHNELRAQENPKPSPLGTRHEAGAGQGTAATGWRSRRGEAAVSKLSTAAIQVFPHTQNPSTAQTPSPAKGPSLDCLMPQSDPRPVGDEQLAGSVPLEFGCITCFPFTHGGVSWRQLLPSDPLTLAPGKLQSLIFQKQRHISPLFADYLITQITKVCFPSPQFPIKAMESVRLSTLLLSELLQITPDI